MEIKIDPQFCKGCLLCLEVCKRGVLKVGTELGPTGYFPVVIKDQEACNGCGLCALICPDAAVTIIKSKVTK